MGDVRSVYRSLASALVDAGFHVAAMDLRGHGDSDVTFDAYDDGAAGSDIVALAEHMGAPVILVGNSAAEAPALAAGLVLLGPIRARPPRRAWAPCAIPCGPPWRAMFPPTNDR